jgi:hypothetical protein
MSNNRDNYTAAERAEWQRQRIAQAAAHGRYGGNTWDGKHWRTPNGERVPMPPRPPHSLPQSSTKTPDEFDLSGFTPEQRDKYLTIAREIGNSGPPSQSYASAQNRFRAAFGPDSWMAVRLKLSRITITVAYNNIVQVLKMPWRS